MPLTHRGPGAGGRGGGEREGGERAARSAPEGGARAHWTLRLPPPPLAPPPSRGRASRASDPQRPGARRGLLTPACVLGPPDKPPRPAHALPPPGLLVAGVHSHGCEELCMGHGATRSKAIHVLARSAASFTPRAAPGTLSRSSRQEVGPSGSRLPSQANRIALAAERGGTEAGKRCPNWSIRNVLGRGGEAATVVPPLPGSPQ